MEIPGMIQMIPESKLPEKTGLLEKTRLRMTEPEIYTNKTEYQYGEESLILCIT